MLPITNTYIGDNVLNTEQTSLTYYLKQEENKINEYINGIKAIKQAVFKILMTEKNKFDIYGDGFGIELSDLFGKSVYYAQSEIPVRIKNALLYDSRITDVYDFSFSYPNEKGCLKVSFFVSSIFGEDEFSMEVNI